jgi:hypothetical protein
MNNTKLELSNHGILDVSETIPLALNFNLNDIRDIRNRGGVWSKTVKLPGTNHNNDILDNVFNVNIQALTFNQQVKEPIRVIVDGFVAFEGIFQIRKISKVYTNSQDFKVEYDCYISSEGSSFYADISGKYLTDLDLSEFDHTWSATTVQHSMTGGTWTDGYQYWLGTVDNEWSDYEARDLIPATYAKIYWDNIFSDAGYTYTFDEEADVLFNKLIIPYNGESYKPLSDIQFKFAAGFSATTFLTSLGSLTWNPATTWVGNNHWSGPSSIGTGGTATIKFNDTDNINEGWFDPSNLYEVSTGRYDVSGFTGSIEFNMKFYTELFLNLVPDGVGFDNDIYFDSTVEYTMHHTVYVKDASGNILDTIYYEPELTNFGSVGGNPIFNTGAPFNYGDNNLYGFDVDASFIYDSSQNLDASYIESVISCTYYPLGFPNWGFYSDFDHQKYDATFKLRILAQNGDSGTFSNIPNTFITSGYPVHINSLIPKKTKQSDFIVSIVNMYNLYITEDKFDPNKLVVRTRDKFYEDGIELDWTDKLDIKSVDIELISNKQNKRKIFTYKEDSTDELSKVYTDQTSEVYGQLEYVFENEFIKDIDKVEPIFSTTFLTRQNDRGGSSVIVPYINARNPKNNLRILCVGDIVDGTWSYYNGNGNDVGNFIDYNSYRFTGHVYPNVEAPNNDIHYGICDYYSHEGATTNNNLYNNHYRTQMNIFDTGHFMTAYFNLSYLDVANLNLNERIYVYDSWWNINKIIDFDLNNRKLTKVELIAADTTIETFVPNYNVVVSKSRPTNMNVAENQGSIDNSSNIVGTGVKHTQILGSGNIILPNSNSNIVIGSNNKIDGSNNVVQGTDVVVNGSNINIFGATGGTFDQSNTTYVNTLVEIDGLALDKTYDELSDMVLNSELIAGRYYYLVDFETIYDRPDYTGVATPNPTIDTITGAAEPLLLMAISPTEFADEVFSPTYPDDYIRYEFGYDTTYVNAEPAKGRIIERRDGDGNRTDYDHREITFKRYDRSGDLNYVWYWDSGADNSTLLAPIGAGNLNIVFGNTVNRMELFADDFNLPNNIIGIGSEDVIIGEYAINNTFGEDINDCTFGKNHRRNQYGDDWNDTNLGHYYVNNVFGNNYFYNTFGNGYTSNTFLNDYTSNTFGNEYASNSLQGTYSNNQFGNDFDTNVFGSASISNTLGNSFSNNTFGNSWSNNYIQNMNGTTIGTSFNVNSFMGGAINCTFGNGIQQTESLPSTSLIGIDFTAGATIIYGIYWKKFIVTSSGNLKLWTINDAGTSTMNAPTA